MDFIQNGYYPESVYADKIYAEKLTEILEKYKIKIEKFH